MGNDRGRPDEPTTIYCTYYKNDGSGTTQTQPLDEQSVYGYEALDPTFDMGWARDGYTFSIWNTSADGTGTDYAVHQSLPTTSDISLYAIWLKDAGPDIEITYKGSTIATMSASGTKTLNTAGSQIATMNSSGTKTLLTSGKYCTDDITIDYTKTGITVTETLDSHGGTIVSISGDPVTSL